ncbi:MAG TPA: FkbM family methyltransferase, partial [Alphaproteobacteria bacterium]|nr:FkbM family methyltransferase [Alphaproteobacteria bacterium]
MSLKRLIASLAARHGYHIGRLPPPAETMEDHLISVLEKYGVSHVVDVGAHQGEYATLLRSRGYGGRVISIEPVRENFEILAEHAASDPAWQAVNCALGASDRRTTIQITNQTMCASLHGSSEYGRQTFGDKLDVRETQQVHVRPLDDLIAEVFPEKTPDNLYLKLDTQGHDLEVLRGAERTLEHVVGFQSELAVKPIYEGAAGFLEMLDAAGSLGFELSALFPVSIDHS